MARAPKRPNRFLTVGSILSLVWLGGIALLAFIPNDWLPFMREADQRVRIGRNYAYGPGVDFWMGSDRLGRDVFARNIYGGRISLSVAMFSIAVGLTLGGILGLMAGYIKGKVDTVINVLLDVLLSFPALILAILVVGRLDVLEINRFWSVMMVLSLLSIAPIARIVRAQTLSLSERDFVLAARSLGASKWRILAKEILPNLVPAMTTVAFTGVAVLMVAEGGLAFLGYSVESPTSSWGKLISENRERIDTAWWATIFPSLMLFATVLAFNIIGDRFARRFDIREAAL
ncbi:MAG TPA: peptide ABC transporter permease [Acidimicrobiaceae bacterium]|nr:peptide ABC transporter permease [Acidimicrobiaceae bacterium]